MISCDDGKTWVGNRSWDLSGDPLLCNKKEDKVCYTAATCTYSIGGACVERQCCNDTPDVPKGIVYGDNQFVATWGWGAPGEVRRSTNGVDWTTAIPADSFGGIAFGGGRFVAATRDPYYSTDGTTWQKGGAADFRNADGTIMWSVRSFAYSDYSGGRFVAYASGDTSDDMLVTSDGAATWWRPTTRPSTCWTHPTDGGILSGNGVIVIASEQGIACRSTDGGQTWTATPTGLTSLLSQGVWTGSQFLFWGDDSTMVSSPDGATWTKTPMVTPMRIGAVARGDSGTIVAISSVWQAYDAQTFLRSKDGLTWEVLPASAFVHSHPFFYMTFGYADPSEACPAH
jgi:hypothetical protein